MLTRNKKLKDYGIPADDIEKLNTMLKDFPAEYGYLLSGAALSACTKNTVIADMVIENIIHRKSYRKIRKERYIPMNPKDFYGYRRKTVAVLYERMRLLGVWEGCECFATHPTEEKYINGLKRAIGKGIKRIRSLFYWFRQGQIRNGFKILYITDRRLDF